MPLLSASIQWLCVSIQCFCILSQWLSVFPRWFYMLCYSIGWGRGGSCPFHYRCFRTFVILHFSFIAGGKTFLGLPEACFHYMIEGVCLSVCLFVCQFVRLFVCLFVYLSAQMKYLPAKIFQFGKNKRKDSNSTLQALRARALTIRLLLQ